MHGSVARITVGLHLTNRIKHMVREGGFDVIHYHEPLMPVLPITALRFSRTINVGTFHAFARSNIGYYYGKPLLKRYVRRLHARIAVSNPAREFVRHYFPGDYRVIPNGIDLSRFQNQPPYSELRDGMCNLLFVGRLEYRKGLGYLLRAFAQLKPQYPKLRPIVATSIDGFREVLTHGREGLLVKRKSRRQLAYALQTLINNAALRQEMGSAGLVSARQYNWERVIDQVADVYKQAIDLAQPAPSVRLEPSLSPRWCLRRNSRPGCGGGRSGSSGYFATRRSRPTCSRSSAW